MRSLVLAPFVMLALGLVGTLYLSMALTGALDGGISFAQFAPVLAWETYGLFVAVFLRLDAFVVGRRPDRTWPSLTAMWRTTLLLALGAAIIALPLAAVVGAATVVTMTPDVGGSGGGLLAIGVLAGLLAIAVRAATKDVRVRRTARIVVRPF